MRKEYDFSKGVRGMFYGKVTGVQEAIDNPDEREAMRCPFCGSEQLQGQSKQFPKAIGYWIGCSSCGASGPLQPSQDAALTAWNNRDESQDEAA